MIELGAFLMLLGLIAFGLLPEDAINRPLKHPWVDGACFAIVVTVLAGITLASVGLSVAFYNWLGR